MGYVGRVVRRTTFVDDVIVFGIFLMVRAFVPPAHFVLPEWIVCIEQVLADCIVSGTEILLYHTRSSPANPRVASYSPTFHQQVSNVLS